MTRAPATEPARPIEAAGRMAVLDVLRGAAVYGILLYNVATLSGYDLRPPPVATARLDRGLHFAMEFLIQGKFYSLFSFLFGVGFAVFLRRAQARGLNAVALFRRRLAGLMCIGIAHSLFLWFGDILFLYAVLGYALIPFVRRDDRTVLRWAAAMLLAPILLYGVMLALVLAAGPPPAPAPDGTLPPVLERAVDGFAHGSYGDVVFGNAVFTVAGALRRIVLMFVPRVFGMFLLGFWAGRANLFGDLTHQGAMLRRVRAWGFAVGLPLAFAGAWLGGTTVPRMPTWRGLVEIAVESVATPALALAYAAAIVLLFMHSAARRVLMFLAPVGRTALSNYLLQSAAGVVVFYGIGFGLFGRVGLAPLLAGAIVFFALQTIVSRWWLARARFGPAEWLWRQWTYRQRLALLR